MNGKTGSPYAVKQRHGTGLNGGLGPGLIPRDGTIKGDVVMSESHSNESYWMVQWFVDLVTTVLHHSEQHDLTSYL